MKLSVLSELKKTRGALANALEQIDKAIALGEKAERGEEVTDEEFAPILGMLTIALAEID